MNVIFLDLDGVINTYHDNSKSAVENRVRILSDICKKNDCKVVISSSVKNVISDNMETELVWVKGILELFRKYNIDCIGKTETIGKRISSYLTLPAWKDHEISEFLFEHPEVEHFCVIDDNDVKNNLVNVSEYLVEPLFYSENPEEEGLLEKHEPLVSNILKKDNNIKKIELKYKTN